MVGGSGTGLLDVADDRAKLESALIAEADTGLMVLQAGNSSGNWPVNPENILRVLEIGTRALMCSHVATPAEAAQVASACRYPPEGTRGLSPFTRIHGYTDSEVPLKLRDANEQMFCGVLVEGREGLANLEAIAATPGGDMVYLGIYRRAE